MDYGRYGGTGFVWPRLTPAVKTLMLINAGVFLLNAVMSGRLTEWCGISWGMMWEGYGLGLVRLITTQFVHSFTVPTHFLLNMLVFYFFGTFVEGEIGRKRLYGLYLMSGVSGGLLHSLLGLVMGSGVPAVGASGAVYGIMVYAAFLAPRMRVIFIIFPIELRWLVGVLVFLGVYMTYVQLMVGGSDGVAHGGHLGGALWGFLAFRMARRQWTWSTKLRAWNEQRQRRASQERQQVLDRLLEKVHREGIGSLTSAERRFLDRTSERMRRK